MEQSMMNTGLFASPEAVSMGSSGWLDYVRVMLILGAILIGAFLLLRFWRPRLAGFVKSSSGPMRINARLAIDANKTLYVVTVGKAVVLLGSSEAGLRLITQLEAADIEEILVVSNQPNNRSSTNFTRYLWGRSSRETS
jgi:flagellar biogenesis protein FliO